MPNRVRSLATARARYTGESYQQAHQAISALRAGSEPIPVPALEQLRFEAHVFEELLDSRAEITSHPLGIITVRPLADSLHLRVDGEETAERLLNRLMPRWEPPDGDLHGVPGLRIRRPYTNAIELHRLGRPASVRLTGLPRRWWRLAERQLVADTLAVGHVLCWRDAPDGWTPREVDWNAEHYEGESSYARSWQRHMWLASGFLRRIALLHTVAECHAADGWSSLIKTPYRWCFDLAHSPDHPPRLAAMARALTHPVFGLHLRVAESWVPPDEALKNGPLVLSDAAGTGELELRVLYFSHGEFDDEPTRTSRRARDAV